MTRRGDWMQTFTGRAVWPLDLRVEDIDIVDIAHSLSLQCRFLGHTKAFYSVAQHCVLIARRCSPANALWGLLHDASEAYLVDVPRPVKPHLAGYKDMERAAMAVICRRFDLPPTMPGEVAELDTAILADEQRDLMGPQALPWNLPLPPLGVDIRPWAPDRAEGLFLGEFEAITQRVLA